VSDAEYLLGVANRRLHLIGDVATTLAALQAADQRLRESGDTAAFKIRKQIAKEISTVKEIKTADIVGVYSSLEALEEQVEQLNLLLPYSGKTQNKKAIETEKEGSDVNDALDEALIEIEGILTIRRLDTPVNAIVTPEQKIFIKERLSSKLMVVKMALLERDDSLYQLSLDDTLQWLNANFTNDRVRLRFRHELERLKAIQLRSNLPDISLSFKMLKDIVKLRLETDKAFQDEDNAQPASE